MKSLLNLSLYTNNLSGLIPETIGYLTELKLLYLYDNQLSGPISSEFGNLKNLNDLELSTQQSFRYSSNNFSFGSALKSFNLHGNKLEGKIPRSLENCQRLEVLDLGDNLLNDTSPMWLGTLPELRVLSLRLNKLHGQIRTSGSEYIFLELRILDLSCNDFSKNLPTILFQYLKAMRTTDQTSKEPRYLGDSYYHDSVMVSSKGLELELRRILTIYTTIDLSNNKFEGYIPSIMGDLIALRVLNLSHNALQGNHLVGEIPPQFASLTSLEVLNLSYNHLEGCIPQGNQFHTFENNSYEGNDRLRGFPLSKGCGNDGHDSASEKTYVGSTLDEESNSEFLNGFWKGALMGIFFFQGKRRKNSDEELNEDEEDDGCGVGKLMLFEGGEHLTLEDVLNAMGQVMEKTSYGTIYKAKLGDGGTIALRLLREGSCKDGGTYLTVIRQLGRVRHDNLIPLRAFYQGKRGEKLLIYDYLPNRNNLHELFHESRVGKPVLNWARRHKIALGIARGLAHLHGLDTPVTHGNVRSKNVLVNEFFVSRLTEFGLDKIMIPSVANDIVSVAKAEGKKPGKNGRDNVDLPALVKVAVLGETTLEVFDMELLKGIRNPMEEGLVQALRLSMGCCAPVATVRPLMDEVVRQLEENRPRNRSTLYSPAETRSGSGEIGYLRSLTKLSSGWNFLNGSIPASLGNLNNLSHLYLYENHLSGSIPAEIGKLVNLVEAYLQTNQLTGDIPPELGNLINARVFYAFSNELFGPIPAEIVLYLLKNNLKGKILQCLGNISGLQYVMMSHNNLSGELPLSICNLTSLRVLDLGRNNLIGAISQCFGNMSGHLEVLDMQHNNLSGTLPTTFTIGSALGSFNLHGNKLEEKIPRSLENCQLLEVLDLGDNHLNDTFPMWLGTLPELRVLRLRLNKLHGPIRTLGSGNMYLELRILDVSSNAFTGNLPTSLFQHLNAMRKIDPSKKAPSDHERYRYYQNSIAVVTKGMELEVVRILFLYTTIDLSNNKFEGHIPSIIDELIALRMLNLSHNGLQGPIPQSLGSLSSVESLDLSGNDGLRGFPLSKGCGNDSHDSVSEKTYAGSAVDEESNSEFLNDFWKAALMGYGTGLCIGLSIIYILISTGNMKWLERTVEELGHKIMMARRKKQRTQRNYRRRNNRF
ncbi:putative kinase-like protein TMKL1 [Capsicum annuum]|nr:putative kinase-like protein TMKL1 [Capsicum annuum]